MIDRVSADIAITVSGGVVTGSSGGYLPDGEYVLRAWAVADSKAIALASVPDGNRVGWCADLSQE